MNSKQLMSVVSISLIILVSILGVALYLYRIPKQAPQFPKEKTLEIENVNFNDTLFRGENLTMIVTLNVSVYNATLVGVKLEASKNERISHQYIFLNQSYSPGYYKLQFDFLPGFWQTTSDMFFALSDGAYKLHNLNYTFSVDNQTFEKTMILDQIIHVEKYSAVNMFSSSTWILHNASGSISSAMHGKVTVVTNNSFNYGLLETQVNAASSYLFNINASSGFNGTLFINKRTYKINNSEISLNLADLSSMINVTLVFNSSQSELTFYFMLLNRKKVILVTVMNDHWEDTFPPVSEILKIVNIYFEKWFNMTFKVALTIETDYSGSTSLPDFFDFAKSKVGSMLNLPQNTWWHIQGRSRNNMGADILLINTNKTMSNYGMVIGTVNGGFNIAANAGGSLKASGVRLTNAWTDNLFQHEISHIFGVPDRRTGVDPPSVMTKSETIEELLSDLANGTLWLELNNWIPEDLLTIASNIIFYEQYVD